MAPGLITRQLDRDEIAALLKRGENFIRSGDLASARLVLQRAAEAGDMHAALTLAATFDRNQLGRDLPADVVKARFWYERAEQLGSTEAPRRVRVVLEVRETLSGRFSVSHPGLGAKVDGSISCMAEM